MNVREIPTIAARAQRAQMKMVDFLVLATLASQAMVFLVLVSCSVGHRLLRTFKKCFSLEI